MRTALAELMHGAPIMQRLASRLLRDRDVVIPRGVGAGLRFNGGPGNPDYALGRNETPVQHALERVLEPGAVFYDIGANVGFFTMIGARLCGPGGQVLAFEPVPENVALVRHNARLNRFTNVEVREVAVSRTCGEQTLLLAHHPGGAVLAEVGTPPDLKGSVLVSTVTIDEVVRGPGVRPPDVVKIDVEGAEIPVLDGMVQTIEEHRPVILFEVDAADRTGCDQRGEECAAWLRERGYGIEELEPSYELDEWFVGHYLAKAL